MRIAQLIAKTLVVGTFYLPCAPVSAMLPADDNQYDALIIEARKGNTQPALTWFSGHQRLDESQIADWMQIALWAGKDSEVIDVYSRHQHYALPARAWAALAVAWRNKQEWKKALNAWDRICDDSPYTAEFCRGRVLTLADSGEYAGALREIRRLQKRTPDSKNYLTEAYVHRLAGNYPDELLAITKAMRLSQHPETLADAYRQALADNQLPSAGLKHVQAQGKEPDARERADAAAELVRLAFMPTRGEKERYVIADRALSLYDGMIAEWKEKPEHEAVYRRIRFDRLGALLARSRHQEVIGQYQQMKQEGLVLPEYAQYWVASAFLKTGQPDRAQAMLSRLFYQNPQKVDDISEEERADLFYSHLESENYRPAKLLTKRVVDTTPATWYPRGSSVPVPNDKWLEGQQYRSSLAMYEQDLARAEALTRSLSQAAPGNQGLLIDHARVLLARGLPRAAEARLKQAELLEPSSVALETEQAYAALDLQEWRQAEELTKDVAQRAPDNAAVKQLSKAFATHERAELRMGGTVSLDSDSPDSGRHDVNVNTTLYSPPLNYNWRGFVGYGFFDGRFQEGKGVVRDGLMGLEWRSRDLWAEAEVSERHFNGDRKVGARLAARVDVNDSWQLGLEGERLSRNAPMRAMKNDITANSGGAEVRWYQHESRQYSARYLKTAFSDGNRRNEYFLNGQEQVWASPDMNLSIQPGVYYGTNSQSDTPYFSPEKRLDVMAGVTLDHRLWRRYENSWTQTFSAGAGNAWQHGYGSGLITHLGYGQRVSWRDGGEAGVAIRWDKRPYDGKQEHNLSVDFNVTLRF
ncbi:poly-beta-1,6 N-acetyl-D-glucosamine export porin PgaA [Enterobacter cloacae complex sp. P40RS]|uniref:Poly-beta-1,6 N-acetyl-D-glucosamine export porin PgaA n=1 Tax=Enterobacter pasteurii TaxID=3029761 RepID=A0ABR9QAL5_9ENTR|nr:MULTISPECIES: poly-beta-1,6 N-acetyl-D-glucosamine export porin PgaA [Enterobacter cloacae complex]MBE4855876.1 poly-beta-1,6 N-acetyl-D-glucosamine export porin PgaA [Enterobacter pasteurii]MBE4864941.1 poly-beta-1,6 N-acetyl-D-glucosamine export porin PgaA [Enterobacter cloacae complex sp. P40C2]MBE4876035.1 poly-beta-1,6 N-acetyl-D-glucosamine export porin PgaA [Enterobacter cloacae complex sp. P40C]